MAKKKRTKRKRRRRRRSELDDITKLTVNAGKVLIQTSAVMGIARATSDAINP